MAKKLFIYVIAALLSFTMISQSALAANIGSVTCDLSGGVTSGQFFSPKLVYKDYDASADGCGKLDTKKFFSGISCSFIVILNSVFSKFYCAVQFGMKEIVVAVIVLYIVVLGTKLLLGMQEATLGATVLAFIKVGVVLTFTTQGIIGIGMIYDFFSNLMMSTINWVVTAINCNPFTNPTCIVDAIFNDVTFAVVFDNIDSKIYTSVMGVPDDANIPDSPVHSGLFSDNAELIAFFVVLSLICPPIFYITGTVIFTTIKFFVSTFVSTLMCLVVVAFLVALSPIFLCFMLFGSTYTIFDNWLRYLVSYSIQPMILFAIFSLWLLIIVDFTDFIFQLQKVMEYRDPNTDKGTVTTENKEGLLFCKLRYTTDSPTFKLPTGGTGAAILPILTFGGPRIACCPLMDDPASTSTPRDQICNPDTGTAALIDTSVVTTKDMVMPKKMIQEQQFIYFLAYHLITLLVICSAFLNILKLAPQIAQELTKSQAQLPLGAGFGASSGGLGSLVSKLSSKTRKVVGKQVEKVVDKVVPALNGLPPTKEVTSANPVLGNRRGSP